MEKRQIEISNDVPKLQGSSDSPVDVSVVIVNYNVCEFLDQALQSLTRASDGLTAEIFVVDNNSADGSVEMVKTRYPHVQLIVNQENLGFGKANNMALRLARGRHVLILNPDTIVQEDTLGRLVAFMDAHPDAGAVGCQILNPDGSFAWESRRSFPAPDVAFYRMIGLSRLFPRSRTFGRYNMTFLPRDETAEVDALSGSCMMLRQSALQAEHGTCDDDSGRAPAGLFDEAFFMYGEDLDLCYRIQKAGWKIFYYPKTQIIHYKGESTKKGELRHVRLFYGAMLLFIEKHLEPDRSRLLRFMLRVGIIGRAIFTLFKSNLSGLTSPLVDFSLVYTTVAIIALLRWIWVGGQISSLFFATVSPVYAVATVVGIWIAGGYRRTPGIPLRPVFWGITAGFFSVAAASYFIPAIAFSRFVVATSFPITAVVLSVWRGIWNAHKVGSRRAVLVGDCDEALRLSRMLAAHPRPPFLLEGYVSGAEGRDGPHDAGPPRIGRLSNLRDLTRLRGIHDIVFAARSFSNQVIFRTMRELQDLNVQFRMLHEGSENVIGKASVSRLSIGTTLAELPEVVELRSSAERRLTDIAVALGSLILMPLAPFILPLARLPFLPTMRKLRWVPSVLAGRMSLVGTAEGHEAQIPASWNLKPGVFSITNTLRTKELNGDDMARAYWFYVTHQSPGLDADIVIRSLREEIITG